VAKQICLFAFGASSNPCFPRARFITIRLADAEFPLEIKQLLAKRICCKAVYFNGSLSGFAESRGVVISE